MSQPRLNLVTNYHPREIKAWADLPLHVARDDFGYVTGEDRWVNRFVQYKGEWYDVSDTESAIDELRARGFDGMVSQTYFSGVAFRRFTADGEFDYDHVVCAMFAML